MHYTNISEPEAVMLLVCIRGVDYDSCNRILAANSLSGYCKCFDLGVTWPQNTVTIFVIVDKY